MSAPRWLHVLTACALAISLSPLAIAAQTPPASSTAQEHDHASHGPPAAAPDRRDAPASQRPSFIPPVTDEDRRAAFPDVRGHAVHDDAVNWFVLVDQLEWQHGEGASGLSWDNTGWIGKDRDRLWFRTEGETADGRVEHGDVHLLYGRAVARWWDLVGGVRQDVRPGSPQTWAAVGIQGLAPYWFEVEGTAYVGAGGRTQFRFETEYEVLLTNRLILQPLVEVQLAGKADPARELGSGLTSAEGGLRLRYLIRREFAPYVGVSWSRKFFGTADLARSSGQPTAGARLVVGLRFWM